MKGEIHVLKEDVQGLKENMQSMQGEIYVLQENMLGMQGSIYVLQENMRDVQENIQDMRENIQGMQENIQDLNCAVTKTNLIIENELRVNLQRVAEGHLDLSRKLDEAKKPNEEVEVLSLKVRRLESSVSDLREKFA